MRDELGTTEPRAGAADLSRRDANQEALGLREFLTVLFMRKTAIVVTFVTVVLAVTGATFLLPVAYEAKARLLVRVGRENVYRPEVGEDKSQVLSLNSEEIINSETNILTSRDLIARVVSTLTVEALYPQLAQKPPRNGTALDAAVERFQKALSVEAVRKSTVIEVSLQHEDPRMAARALNLLVDFFREKHLQAYSDPKSSYLEQQLASYDHRLKESQDHLEAFKQENRVFSLDEQRSLLLRQRTELDTALKATENQISELREHIASVRLQLPTIARDIPLATETERYRSVDDAQGQLLGLQLKEQDLLRKYTESNSLVVSVRREIEIVRTFIASQEQDIKGRRQTGQNVVYQDLEREMVRLLAELPAQEAKAVSLGRQLAALDVQIPTLDRTEMTLANLKREIAVNDQNYRTYVEKVEDARVLEDLNRQKSANISVIQQATVGSEPVKPRKLLNVVLGLIAGALAGVGFAFVSELLALGLSTPESAERRLRLPVLTTIPLKR